MVHLFLPFFFLIKCTLSIVISSVSKPTFACRKTSSFVLLSSHVSLFTRDISLMPINRKLFLRCLSSSSAICSFILVFYSNKFWTSSLFLLSVSGFCFSSVMSVSFSRMFHFETLMAPAMLSLHLSVAFIPLACLLF